MDKLILFKGNRKMIVSIEDILYLKADDKYTEVVLLTGERLFSSRSLKCTQDHFSGNTLFRIHRKYSINLRYFSEYIVNGEKFVIMMNGIKIPLAARKKAAFNARIGEYIK